MSITPRRDWPAETPRAQADREGAGALFEGLDPCHHATLARPVEVEGVGLHSGSPVRVRLVPDERSGLRFRRVDLPRSPEVEARFDRIVSTHHATVLEENGARVSTPEHLLAALWCAGLTHVRIELDAPEIPILDGSSARWLEALTWAGIERLESRRPLLRLDQGVSWRDGEVCVSGRTPASKPEAGPGEFTIRVAIDFAVPGARAQEIETQVSAASFAREIAPARTFALESWLEPLRAAGLIRGGSLDNALVLSENGPLNSPRFADEPARHKALDLLGDLALLWGPARFEGTIEARRAGHGAHHAWMLECAASQALRQAPS